jgi:hypothetical protein
MVDITDSASSSIMNFTVQINKDFTARIDSIEQFVTNITKFSRSASASAPGYLSSLEGKIKDLAIGVDKLDAMSDALLKYAGQVEKNGLLGLDNGSRIKGKIDVLRDAIGHLKDRLLKFQVYLK